MSILPTKGRREDSGAIKGANKFRDLLLGGVKVTLMPIMLILPPW
jgi:hypothetical protein